MYHSIACFCVAFSRPTKATMVFAGYHEELRRNVAETKIPTPYSETRVLCNFPGFVVGSLYCPCLDFAFFYKFIIYKTATAFRWLCRAMWCKLLRYLEICSRHEYSEKRIDAEDCSATYQSTIAIDCNGGWMWWVGCWKSLMLTRWTWVSPQQWCEGRCELARMWSVSFPPEPIQALQNCKQLARSIGGNIWVLASAYCIFCLKWACSGCGMDICWSRSCG